MIDRLPRRLAPFAAAAAIVAGTITTFAPHASAATTQSALHYAGSVTMSDLHGTAAHVRAARPPVDTSRRTSSGARVAQAGAGTRHITHVAADGGAVQPQALASPTVVEQLQSFNNLSKDAQVSAIGGNNQDVTPPDTQLATGPTKVLESTNSAFLTMGHHGENPTITDQYLFWGTAIPVNNAETDARVVYDADSQHFFASALFFAPDPNTGVVSDSSSVVGLAMSIGTDPTGTWQKWTFNSNAKTLNDQPLLGMNTDKVVLSWNAFDTSGTNNQGQLGAQFLVVDKAALIAGNVSPGTHASGTESGLQSIVPAISQSPTTTEYLVYNQEDLNNFTWEFVKVVPVTGVPTTGGTDTTAFDFSTPHSFDITGGSGAVSAPPFAEQPNNGHLLDDSDGRMQSVVFSGGTLYTAGSLANPPAPNCNNTLSALLVEKIVTGNWGFDDAVLCSSTQHLFDPAVVVDGNGVPFYAFTRSGTTRFASSGAFAFDWAGALKTAGIIAAGTGNGDYACGSIGCELFHNTTTDIERWGDFSGIAVDPSNPNDVWAATEFAPSNGSNWGTSVARLTISQPVVTGIDVGSGRTSGGTTVTITGNEFDPGSGGALFGGVAAWSAHVVDPEHIVAVTPPHAAGGANVQATTADGTSSPGAVFTFVEPPLRTGYWFVASDGGIFAEGAQFFGSHGGSPLNQPIVGMAPTPSGRGYWLVARDGGIFSYGDATFHGSTGNIRLNQPIVGMAATPDGGGYWMVASDGGIFAFGDAPFRGSHGGSPLNQPIVGMASTPTGMGYWLVARDGGIFTYGDATFHGSAGAIRLNKPIVGMTATTDGGGYWLVASDGGIFTYGEAVFRGSAGAIRLNQPIVGMTQSGDDAGYWLVASDGGIFTYGDAPFKGSTGNIRLNQPIVGMASVPA
jgi:hypothetical protein